MLDVSIWKSVAACLEEAKFLLIHSRRCGSGGIRNADLIVELLQFSINWSAGAGQG